MMVEKWKIVVEAPDYEVSDHGHVRRCRPDRLGRMSGKLLATPLNDKGYPHLNLHVGGRQYLRRVHRLVCEAFHGPRPSLSHEVRHLNGDRTDNRASNLTWGTSTENKLDTARHGRAHRRHVAPVLQPEHVREIRSSPAPRKELARRFGVSPATITLVRNGQRHAGVV